MKVALDFITEVVVVGLKVVFEHSDCASCHTIGLISIINTARSSIANSGRNLAQKSALNCAALYITLNYATRL